jgi:uncharacterized membrane protein
MAPHLLESWNFEDSGYKNVRLHKYLTAHISLHCYLGDAIEILPKMPTMPNVTILSVIILIASVLDAVMLSVISISVCFTKMSDIIQCHYVWCYYA